MVAVLPTSPPRARGGGREKARRLAPDARRAQILDVAAGLFGTRPYGELNVSHVARAAGVTQGLVYHYFPSKTALFVAAFERRTGELMAMVLPDLSAPLVEQMRHVLRGYLDFAEANRVAYVNLFRGTTLLEPEFASIVRRTRGVIVDHLLSALRVERPRAPATALALLGYVEATELVAIHWLESPSLPRASLELLFVAMMCAAMVNGLLVDGVVPPGWSSLASFDRELRDRLGLVQA